MHNYRFDYAPEGNAVRGVSYARLGFSREAQRTQSSSSSDGGGGGGDCLHLPSDKDEADWLCLDFDRARRELRASVDAASAVAAAAAEEER